jgi:hypothetical protein
MALSLARISASVAVWFSPAGLIWRNAFTSKAA